MDPLTIRFAKETPASSSVLQHVVSHTRKATFSPERTDAKRFVVRLRGAEDFGRFGLVALTLALLLGIQG